MDKTIETYLNQMVNELNCDEKEKKEIAEEMNDHLNLLKNEYIEQGFTDEEAIQKALKSFGELRKISNGYQESLYPYYKLFRGGTWILFGLYSLVLLWNLLFVRMIDRIINHDLFNRYFWYPQNYNSIFDMEVWKLNASIIPFKNSFDYITGSQRFNLDIIINNTVGNILIFLPLGMFLPILFKKYNMLSKVFISSIIISFLIEALQFSLQIGQFDIDDIILNTIGCIIGYFVIITIYKIRNLPKKNIFQETKS
ncbi:VanZ family protein [Bacillus sp. 165]|uniref:VanZ family protein n=1 Tax=Bacillus sp. 165 TaxID=1529117 RepID=UPI001ADC298A|nr:VanZ family protein [Bacillus sp. 165]MBO9128535.1 VanZ family protein [Bacillus sp. 165]